MHRGSKISSLIAGIKRKQENMNDFNVQYAKLDKNKVNITLKDIYVDYKNFRKNYYQKIEVKEERPIDPKKLSIKSLIYF